MRFFFWEKENDVKTEEAVRGKQVVFQFLAGIT